MTTANIAIVGAGLMGRLLAWRSLLQGHNITLFEAGSFTKPTSAAHTAAAMIAPLSEAVLSERPIYNMGMQSLHIWPDWIAQLNEGVRENSSSFVHYYASGSIAVAHQQDHSELRQFKQDLQAKLGGDDSSEWLNQEQLQNLEPALAHFQQGVWLPAEAYLDNRQLLRTLLEQIVALGGLCQEYSPVTVNENGIEAHLETDRQQTLDAFDIVVDCRGIGAKSSLPSLRGVRGEVMWVETNEIRLQHPVRLMHPRYKLYVVPKPNHQFIIGATEIESEDRSPISLQSNLELASALYTINPIFAEARIIETDVNLRPAFPDNLPKVERNGRTIRVNGLYRHGYLLAPVLVNQILQHIKGGAVHFERSTDETNTREAKRA